MKKAGLNFLDLRMAVLVHRVVPAAYTFIIHTENPTSRAKDEMFAELVHFKQKASWKKNCCNACTDQLARALQHACCMLSNTHHTSFLGFCCKQELTHGMNTYLPDRGRLRYARCVHRLS